MKFSLLELRRALYKGQTEARKEKMRQYELTYLISDLVPESDLNKVTGKVCGYITSLDGKVLKEEIWGRRKLAYPIKKQDFATYVTVNFELSSSKAQEFERNIFLTGKIIRHLMIVTEAKEEKLSLSKDEVVDTKELEAVVGGERSFESIEGETEESKDLMLKREESTKAEETQVTKEEKEVDTEKEVQPETKDKTKSAKKEKKTEEKEEKEEKKPAKKQKKAEGSEDVDRLSKLDKELDDILGDDL